MQKYQKMQQKIKNILWKGRFLIQGVITTAMGCYINTFTVHARTSIDDSSKKSDNSTLDYSFITNSKNKNDAIDGVTTKVEGIGASGYRLISVLCICAFFVCGGIAMFRLMIHKNGQKREDTKDWITWILFAVAGFSALGFIFSTVSGFARGL